MTIFHRLILIASLAVITITLSARDLPPVEAFFHAREYLSPTLSPDGNHLAYVGEVKGKSAIIHLNLKSGATEVLASGINITRLLWKGNDRLICDGSFATASIFDLRTRAMTPIGKKDLLNPTYICDYAEGFSNVLIISRREEVAALNLDTGNEEVIQRSAGNEPFQASKSILSYAFDSSGTVCAYLLKGDKESQLMVRNRPSGKFSALKHWPVDETGWQPVGLGADGKTLLVLARAGGDFPQLQQYDFQTQALTPVLPAPLASDIVGIRFSPARREITGFVILDRSSRTLWLNPEWVKRQRMLNASFPDKEVHILGYSDDERVCAVEVVSPTVPSELYVGDLSKHDLRLVARDNARPVTGELSPMEAVDIPSRDETVLHGYLVKSKFAAASAGALILRLNPNPFGKRTVIAYDGEAQFFANRGYSVLMLDYRGVPGYGEKYESAGRGEIAGKIIDDINDVAKWAIAQGHCAPGKICLYGEGIAGGMALVAAGAAPDLYGCLVLKNSKTDWKHLSADYAPAFKAWFDVSEKTAKYKLPLPSAAEVTAPVFDLWRNRSHVNPAVKAALKKSRKEYVLAGFLDARQYHEESAYGAFEAQSIVDFLDKHISNRGATNTGIIGSDARWDAYRDYLDALIQVVQSQWYKILNESRASPPSGTNVTVKFLLNLKGEVEIVEVHDNHAGKSGVSCCINAITSSMPYPKWTAEMIGTLGDSQELTFSFYYQ